MLIRGFPNCSHNIQKILRDIEKKSGHIYHRLINNSSTCKEPWKGQFLYPPMYTYFHFLLPLHSFIQKITNNFFLPCCFNPLFRIPVLSPKPQAPHPTTHTHLHHFNKQNQIPGCNGMSLG